MRFRVCKSEDAPKEGMRAFQVEGIHVPVLLLRDQGELIAVSGMCPHEDVELGDGLLLKDYVVCPGHGYSFNVRSGVCSHDPNLKLPRFRVISLGDEIFIEILGAGA